MFIREVLINNNLGDFIPFISDKILETEVGNCTVAREIPLTKEKLFDGVDLYPVDEDELIRLNIEDDDEFVPIAFFKYDDEGYLKSETGFDNDMNFVYHYDD